MPDGRVNNGGARSRSGPKPKAEKFEGEITKADKRLAKNLIKHIENMERLAEGVLTQETNALTGKRYVYEHPPNRQANEYLINRVMGKPIERQVISSPDGGPLTVTEVVVHLAKDGTVDAE